MTLQTDLSRSPYFDDYDSTKNFYRVLYRPSVALQTRELNQMQTILQDQIDKFGRHIFKEGSVIEGCSFTFDSTYSYVKIQDNYANSTAFTITDFSNNYITNSNGLKALIVNTQAGYESQDPNLNSLFIKYLNTGSFPNGSPQSTFANAEVLRIATVANVAIGNVTVATVANSTGMGYAFSTTSGIIFQKGFFVQVNPQTIIVSKFSNEPDNISVGFDTIENIITPEADTSLYDNAAGSPNYSAPGAHRLQLVPTLVTRLTTDIANTTSFFSLCDFKEGKPVSIKNDPQYAIIGAEMARRTYETNGDYVVHPFVLSTEPKPTNDSKHTSYLNLVSSRGLGYVNGYRVEYVNNNKIAIRKGNDYESISSQVVSANFGYYVGVNQFCGEFDSYDLIEVELHSAPKNAITTGLGLTTSYSAGTKIGTAFIRGVSYDSGLIGSGNDIYNVYLFDINMNQGKNFYDVKSIINYNGATIDGIGDVVLTFNVGLNANVATIQQSQFNNMIFPFGQKGMKLNGFQNTQYVYRDRQTASFSTLATGSMTISLPAHPHGTGAETLDQIGTLSKASINKFIVTPVANGYTTSKTGTISATSSANVVTGSATAFLIDYMVGDYIHANGENHLITFIANNTSLTTLQNWSSSPAANVHSKAFLAGVPLDFTKSNGVINRGITTTSTTATFTLGETLTGSFQAKAYYDLLRSATKPISKAIKRNLYVAINCASAGVTGPFSLGLPDAYRINNIYINNDTFANSGVDYTSSFKFDTGQRDAYYGLASITPSGAPLNTKSRIIVDFDAFVFNRDLGVGFFTANSYPIDDTNGVANTNAILTQEIPQYTGADGSIYDLRDCVDFRPFAANTATSLSNSSNWGVTTPTINPSSVITFDVFGSYGSFLPSPDANFQSDIQHYLGRKDRVVISTDSTLRIIEGSANNNPIPPNELPGSMTLGIVDVPPYPSLSTPEASLAGRYDYAVTVNISQNKRYTMKDIHTLANKIDNLEYYTSLSLLEKSAKDTLVRSSATGQNRFQNGILVDPFQGHDIGNVQDPAYLISIDQSKTEMRPAFHQFHRPLKLDPTTSTNVVEKGDAILLNYTTAYNYIKQPFASKYRNCIDGNIFVWSGEIKFSPPGDYQPDITKSPDVVTNIDLASNFTAISAAYGTQWGNWTTTGTAVTSATSDNGSKSTTDSKGNVINTTKTQTVTTTSTVQQRAGTQLNVTTATNNYNLGTYVTDVSILPYVRSISVIVTVHGLKPKTRVYAFMSGVDVNAWIRQCDGNFNSTNPPVYVTDPTSPAYGDIFYGTKSIGDPLISDHQGILYAKFLIPPSTFKSTTLEMTFVDVPDPVVGADAITTKAVGTFYGSNISTAKGSSILSAREAVVSVKQITDQSTITDVVTKNDEKTVIIPGPSRPEPWYPPYDGGSWPGEGSGGGGGGGCGNGAAGGEAGGGKGCGGNAGDGGSSDGADSGDGG